jgi:hypothetical protein
VSAFGGIAPPLSPDAASDRLASLGLGPGRHSAPLVVAPVARVAAIETSTAASTTWRTLTHLARLNCLTVRQLDPYKKPVRFECRKTPQKHCVCKLRFDSYRIYMISV